jgi:hypothetical protein
MEKPVMLQPHTNISLRLQPSGKTESLLAHVRNLTRELQSIKGLLYRELAEEEGVLRNLSRAPSSAPASDIQALKAAADEIRQLLWFCLQKISGSCDAPALHDCGESANQVQPAFASDIAPITGAEPGSFFERLHLVIDGYMQNRGIACGEKFSKY